MKANNSPYFFENIRSNAAKRWDQLEADEELAGPWWQLFKQIQSPRHVLSELLQNADDAGAHFAEVRIQDGYFIFEHDGEDFNEDQFASICKFGFSNKRNLHTIGFRGIGFKSTFSLGDEVELTTPSLSVKFLKERFTEPVWIDKPCSATKTQISVRLKDDRVKREIEKSFIEWTKSTLSLLFFHNLNKLIINRKEFSRSKLGKGPIPGSERIKLTGHGDNEIIRIISNSEEFPAEALEEIRQERMTSDSSFSLPPCTVEIVLGIEGTQNLYVVLPTDTKTELPFSINAPFIQDPARMGIKDPSISPTNYWLLKRIGDLASISMGKWLSNEKISLSERVDAYQLLPKYEYTSLGCDSVIRSVFSNYLNKYPVILTSNGEFAEKCFTPHNILYDIWDTEKILIFAGDEYSSILAKEIPQKYRDLLKRWGLIKLQSDELFIEWFNAENKYFQHNVPIISSHSRIIQLWEYFLKIIPSYKQDKLYSMKIFPSDNSEYFLPPKDLVRIGNNIQDLSEEHQKYLSDYLKFVDHSFLNYLDMKLKNRISDESRIISLVLTKTKMDKETSSKKIIENAYNNLSSDDDPKILITLAHIACLLDTSVPKNFIYYTQDSKFHSIDEFDLSFDAQGALEEILPESFRNEHTISDDYLASLDSNKRKIWSEWAQSPKSGLKKLIGIENSERKFYSKKQFIDHITSLGGEIPDKYPIRREAFLINDSGIKQDILTHIDNVCSNVSEEREASIWSIFLELLLSDESLSWKNYLTIDCYQLGNSYRHQINCENIYSSWIHLLAGKKCLIDTDGFYRYPHELLMRNSKTEPLMGIEPFINQKYEKKGNYELLIALGVRDVPGSPDSVVERIKIFAGFDNPPELELIKLYEMLDGILKHCTLSEVEEVRQKFVEIRMIYTEEKKWAYSHEVFRKVPGNNIPGIYRVITALGDLSLWQRIGVESEPSLDILINQLKNLKSGMHLESEERDRVRMILSKDPYRVIYETNHWISVDSYWLPATDFSYYLLESLKGGVDSLFSHIKKATADFRMIETYQLQDILFYKDLKDLQSLISMRISDVVNSCGEEERKEWMETLGNCLCRVQNENSDDEKAIREIGKRLSETYWVPVTRIGLIPYIEEIPAGREQTPEIYWDDRKLYIMNISQGRLLDVVPTELKKSCQINTVGIAIERCYERSPKLVRDYCAENFSLAPEILAKKISAEEGGTIAASGTNKNILNFPKLENNRIYSDITNKYNISDSSETIIEDKQNIGSSDNSIEETQTTNYSDISKAENNIENGFGVAIDESNAEYRSEDSSSVNNNRKKQSRHSIIEVFVENQQYNYDWHKKRYINTDGSWMEKSDKPFDWEIRSPDGELIVQLWFHDGFLRNGIDIPAEAYGMIERNPDKTAIVLRAEDEGADVISGSQLITDIKNQDLGLFPAKYRLRKITN